MKKTDQLKNEINELIKAYYQESRTEQAFIPGETPVPVSGKVFDHKELQMITEAALDGWFTTGRFNTEFEKKLSRFIDVKHLMTVNSGSSANLLAIASLFSAELGDRAVKPGDEFISVAASFPTTINPILLYGGIPVFVDVDIPTYNIRTDLIEAAITDKTKAIVVAHTLGNPFNLEEVMRIAQKYNLWVVEDCCDALGAKYQERQVGSWGDVGTLSFYPAHHITMGEGGAVFTNHNKLKKIILSLRDWGRDCWCATGTDNTCGKRFQWQLGDLPMGYDHKYIYSRLGYNLKITDMQSALGLAQLEKLETFIAKRQYNFTRLYKGLEDLKSKIILPEPTPQSTPSWFGFLITLKESAGITRHELLQRLDKKRIGTRLLFGGDITKQPYMAGYPYRCSGELVNTRAILERTFWIGVTPLITDAMLDYVIDTLHIELR